MGQFYSDFPGSIICRRWHAKTPSLSLPPSRGGRKKRRSPSLQVGGKIHEWGWGCLFAFSSFLNGSIDYRGKLIPLLPPKDKNIKTKIKNIKTRDYWKEKIFQYKGKMFFPLWTLTRSLCSVISPSLSHPTKRLFGREPGHSLPRRGGRKNGQSTT